MHKKEMSKKIAEMLLTLQAMQINVHKPYDWASGWKAPVYCNSRDLLGYAHQRDIVKEMLLTLVLSVYKYGDNQNVVVAGVAKGGVAWGVLIADMLKLPFVSVDHNDGAIEGLQLNQSHVVLVIEDLVSTGRSSLKAVKAIRATGAEVLGMAALFTYDFDEAAKAFEEADVELVTLTDYHIAMQVAQEQSLITAQDKPILDQWRKSPATWMQS